MEVVFKSVYYLKTRFFLVWPECPGDGSFNIGRTPNPQSAPGSLLTVWMGKRVEHGSKPAGGFLRNLRWEDLWRHSLMAGLH